MDTHDRELGMHRRITRRDFLNGIAFGAGAAATSSLLTGCRGKSGERAANGADAPPTPEYYPPALTGMRGSHEGSYEVAHGLRDRDFWTHAGPVADTRERYDLVIVGAGMSGLAAAYFYRAEAGPGARILILDNHDDFGGHAKRNEFRVGGRLLVGYGGTQSIETPSPYSREAKGLLAALGIDPPALDARANDRNLYRSLGLAASVFFNRETFGVDRLVVGANSLPWPEFVARTPLSPQARKDIVRIQTAKIDYMPGLSSRAKKERLSKISYKAFLLDVVKAHPDVIPFYQTRTHGLYGIGIDAVPALDCWGLGYPGFQGMNLAEGPAPHMSLTAAGEATPNQPPYHFHFPDGNASIARLLVRSLVPDAVPGRSADDIVTARVDYSRLDRPTSAVRIRLNSTAVKAVNVGDPSAARDVEVTYSLRGKLAKVHAGGCVLACWNGVIPLLCPELPAKQKEALAYGVKVPLVYTNVAIRNWTSFHTLGVSRISAPGCYHTSVSLDQPISLGAYRCSRTPDEPIVLHLLRTPCRPGLPARDQQRAGHVDLITTSFETFERHIRDELGRMLGDGGFDPARDIAAITVNRWPHGYAYEYNPLWDPDWPEEQQPCVIGRKPFGRITIANSDAAAYAYTSAAIDQGYRAVQELMAHHAAPALTSAV